MSVATEFPPTVHIPERARLAAPAGCRVEDSTRHLVLVPAAELSSLAPLTAPRRSRVRQPQGLRFAESRLEWPLTVVPPAARPVRLTRRGYAALALITVALGILLLLVAHASAGSAPADRSATSVTAATVTVQPGDTLWAIAKRAEPNRDPRQVVDRLRTLNHLGSATLTPGQTLKLS